VAVRLATPILMKGYSMSVTYQYSWNCKNCGHENTIERTKFEAAFDHSPELKPCTKCGGTDYSSASFDLPGIDLELLEAWHADPNLYFLSQDEDLIIADTDLDVLKAFVEKNDTNVERAKSIGPVFAVKFYDDNFNSPKQRKWCVRWLVENESIWVHSTDKYITKKIKPILKKEFENDQK